MPSHAHIKAALADLASKAASAPAAAGGPSSASSLINPTIVCVGGTSGIGEAIAKELVSLSAPSPDSSNGAGPTVHLVGRNREAAETIIDSLRQIRPAGVYRFHSCDLTMAADVRRLSDEIASQVEKVDFLVLTPGILTMAGRTETSEGNDRKMMLHFYSRMAILDRLDSLGKIKPGARVLSVLDSLRGSIDKLKWDDLDLKHNYSLGNAANHCLTMTDIALQRFGSRHPGVDCWHFYPGIVKTPLLSSNLPWYARAGAAAFAAVSGVTPDQSAQAALYPMLAVDEATSEKASYSAGGAYFSNNKGDPIASKKQIPTEQQMENVWQHMRTIAGLS